MLTSIITLSIAYIVANAVLVWIYTHIKNKAVLVFVLYYPLSAGVTLAFSHDSLLTASDFVGFSSFLILILFYLLFAKKTVDTPG
jgi:hypothetical protein